jgi:hypothetical protein
VTDSLRRTGRTTRMLEAAQPGDHIVMPTLQMAEPYRQKYPALKFASLLSGSRMVRGGIGEIHIDHSCYESAGLSLAGGSLDLARELIEIVDVANVRKITTP